MHCTKMSAEFKCEVIASPWVRTPKNVAVDYDVGKISAGYLVVCYCNLHLDPMTLTYEIDPDTYVHIKYKLSRSRL